jgi:hypothetical protein
MPFPVLDDAFFIILTQPDHSKFDTIRWSYETKFKGVIPVPGASRDYNTLKYAADQMRVNFFNTTEAFEPRLVSRIKAWAGEDRKRLHAL